MLKLIKWVIALFAAIFLFSAAFAFYTHFLVDYSLESLETALAATESSGQMTFAAENVYRSLVDDVALEEITADTLDMKKLAMSETSARSFTESMDRNGRGHANVYLSRLTKKKKANQNFFFRCMDAFESQLQRLSRFLSSFSRYFGRKIEKQKDRKTAAFEAARFVLLSKVQNLEKNREYTKLTSLYRQYLSSYPGSPDYGFVTLALADLLVRQNRAAEAQQLFRNIQRTYAGKIESEIAARGLRKISSVSSKAKLIDRFKYSIATTTGEEKLKLQLKLAKTYISVYRFSDAEDILNELRALKEPVFIRQQAEFYLGWIYKREKLFAAAEKIFLGILDSRDIALDFEIGIRAQLADIYYRTRNPEKAILQYDLINVRFAGGGDNEWKGFSAFEQANIYFYDLKDNNKASFQLETVNELFPELGAQQKNVAATSSFFKNEERDLRTRGFQAIRSNDIGLAFEMFTKYDTANPNDSWNQAGLATIYLIMGDLKQAQQYVEKAYRLQSDEYTASLVGYIEGVQRNYSRASEMYKKALGRNADYLPARFNLACMYIKMKEYEQAVELLSGMESMFNSNPPLLQAKILNNLGYVYWRMGRVEQALENFQKAVKIEPDYVVAAKNFNFIQKAARSNKV